MEIKEEKLKEIAVEAGEAILAIYNDPATSEVVDFKADNSPLTLADQASHKVLVKRLEDLYPNVPIVSEEGEVPDFTIRKNLEYYWLLDPLDGTKEFINRNGQFTVNIALIHKHESIFGIVYTPFTEELYYGDVRHHISYKQTNENKVDIVVNNKSSNRIAVRSKSHASVEEENVLSQYDVSESISVGSSLKFCMLAEGKADVYYRHGPTMEWDTAAGQAVLEAAGGKVFEQLGPNRFRYNRENMLNGSFLCLGFPVG